MSETAQGVDMPRMQSGAHPQHLLATLLGDYDFAERAPVPSAAIVRLLAEFGVTSVSARNTLSRLARRGLIEHVRDGRRMSYRLCAGARRNHDRRMFHFLRFGAEPVPDTGRWTAVVFSLPERQRDRRRLLRARLQEHGLAPLFDGVWIGPGDRREATAAILAEMAAGPAAALMLVEFASGLFGGRDPLSAFDLEGLRAGYEEFVARYTPLLRRVRTGDVQLAEALVLRTELMDSWRTFPDADPGLPAALLPADWPLKDAREIFVEIHETLAPLAELRLRSLLEPYVGERAREIRAYGPGAYTPHG